MGGGSEFNGIEVPECWQPRSLDYAARRAKTARRNNRAGSLGMTERHRRRSEDRPLHKQGGVFVR